MITNMRVATEKFFSVMYSCCCLTGLCLCLCLGLMRLVFILVLVLGLVSITGKLYSYRTRYQCEWLPLECVQSRVYENPHTGTGTRTRFNVNAALKSGHDVLFAAGIDAALFDKCTESRPAFFTQLDVQHRCAAGDMIR